MIEQYIKFFQMISFYFKSFFNFLSHWLTPNGCLILGGVFLLMLMILKFQSGKKSAVLADTADINDIAGDDVIATQLDLARAYIEMGEKKLAKDILNKVIKQGSASQQLTAKFLLGRI